MIMVILMMVMMMMLMMVVMMVVMMIWTHVIAMPTTVNIRAHAIRERKNKPQCIKQTNQGKKETNQKQINQGKNKEHLTQELKKSSFSL